MSLKLDLNKGTVRQDIAEMPEKMLQAAFDAVMQAAKLMQGTAQVTVRVQTGSLRDDIRIVIELSDSKRKTVKVVAGGTVINPKSRRVVDYADIIEQKYPFMKPAWATASRNLEDTIIQKVTEKVNR